MYASNLIYDIHHIYICREREREREIVLQQPVERRLGGLPET